MKNMKKIFYAISFLLFALSDEVFSYNILEQTNNGFGIGATVVHLSYREPEVQNYGTIYGLSLDLRNVFYERLYADFYGDFATGKIQYDGVDKYTHAPLKHKNDSDLFNVDGKLGVILLNTEYFQLIPYGGLGFHYWKQSSINKYYNFKAIAGTRVNFALFDNTVLSPYVNIGTTFGSHVKFTNYDPNGNINGKFNLKLGNKVIREVGVEINHKLDDQMFLFGTMSYTRFGYGQSEWRLTTDGLYQTQEPDSKTNEIRFGIGMRFGFL
jgi:hypothetical protein